MLYKFVIIPIILLLPTSILLILGQNEGRKFVKWEEYYGGRQSMLAPEMPTIQHSCGPEHTNNWFIYCQGRILEAVNAHKIFKDSKDFVDSPMKKGPKETLAAFNAEFGNSTNIWELDPDRLKQFVEDNFDGPGSELVNCVPVDWRERPKRLMAIQDRRLREWALGLNGIWKKLCKKINPDISTRMDRYSLIYVPNEFIAPGGRFREFYYWDAYWIIRGLIASEMDESAKKMIRNLAHMVKSFGMVPNGGRVYYLRRSQPPLLAPMLFEYYQHTQDLAFLHEMLPILEMEIEFWDRKRRMPIWVEQQNGTYFAYLYKADSNVPRPESFKEDMSQTDGMDEEEKAFFFRVIPFPIPFFAIFVGGLFRQSVASAAESGWDFSSRWLRFPSKLATIETVNILPVDLNAFMCWNFNILEDLYMAIAKFGRAKHFRNRKFEMQDLLESLFYNKTTGVWYDYNLRSRRHNTNFYPSIAMPLFTGCYDEIDGHKSERLFAYMKENGVFDYPGGIPTSMVKGTGEQWDFPNGWSPLNHIVIEGLRKSQNAQMEEQAFQLAKKWVLANLKVFQKTKHMWEKYNVIGEAEPGKGGEYEVQDGFGWTNGVILDLLVAYHDRLVSPNDPANGTISSLPPSLTPTLLLTFLILSLPKFNWN